MAIRRVVLAILCVGLLATAQASAAPPNPLDDGSGKEWRQLYETTGMPWSQVAEICPRDGVTPCSGSIGTRSLTGWVWATDAQVVALMGVYEPAILTATPRSVSSGAFFGSAMGFLAEMRWTDFISLYNAYTEWTACRGLTPTQVGTALNRHDGRPAAT